MSNFIALDWQDLGWLHIFMDKGGIWESIVCVLFEEARGKMGKGRAPCCDKSQVKRGPWSPVEDLKLINFIQKHGHENWRALPRQSGKLLYLSLFLLFLFLFLSLFLENNGVECTDTIMFPLFSQIFELPFSYIFLSQNYIFHFNLQRS